jgi:cell division protein FtsB
LEERVGAKRNGAAVASHAAPARRPVIRRRPSGSNIRWDRLGRLALLGMLGVICLLYVSPVKTWIQQSRTESHQVQELQGLQQENARLKGRLNYLQRPDAIDREARRLGMVKRGERAYVFEKGR